MSGATPRYPSYWVRDSQLGPLLFDAFAEGVDGISWQQAVAEVAYLLAVVLASNEEDLDQRRDVGIMMAEMIRHASLTGTVDRGPLQ